MKFLETKERWVLVPLLVGLGILYLNSGVVPNVADQVIRVLVMLAFFGYFLYVIFVHPLYLRFGTASLLALGAVRSYGYLADTRWSPMAVWMIVASLSLLTHYHLRRKI